MFNQDNVIEFINKLINQVDSGKNEEVEANLRKFRAYLELTQMCDDETLTKVDKVLDCYDSLIDLKNNFGFVDVTSFFSKKNIVEEKKLVKKKTVKSPQPSKDKYEDKHYRHYSSSYHEPVVSSGCGGSISYSSGCGGSTSYHSSYNYGSSFRSGC